MGNFKGNRRNPNRSGASSRFDRDHKPARKFSREKPAFRSDRIEQNETSNATCYKCGKPCRLPFVPSGDKPVYCRDCFKKPNERNGRERNYDSPRGRDVPQDDPIEQINAKLDKIMRALNIK